MSYCELYRGWIGWVGGWVGLVEEEAVRMSYCTLGVGLGGWVEIERRKRWFVWVGGKKEKVSGWVVGWVVGRTSLILLHAGAGRRVRTSPTVPGGWVGGWMNWVEWWHCGNNKMG